MSSEEMEDAMEDAIHYAIKKTKPILCNIKWKLHVRYSRENKILIDFTGPVLA